MARQPQLRDLQGQRRIAARLEIARRADERGVVARPTGIAVGALGSLFIADDQNGYVYRVRPN